MKIKFVAIILAILLVLIEGYLIVSYLFDNASKSNEIQSYCTQKCDYNSQALTWEFSGDTFTKGFTTKEECFNYCSKVKEGFTASLLGAFSSLIKK